MLDGEITVFETIDNVATGDMRTRVRDILGAFMFGGEAVDKKVKVLSGGEKTRLAMIRLLLEPVNFLILDEPTNHLDISTKDILKEAIRDFSGTVIVVSHDRYFLDGLVDKVYEFGDGKVRENLGGIYDFLRRKNLASLNQLETRSPEIAEENSPAAAGADGEHDADGKTEGRLSYAEQKERQRQISRVEKAIRMLEEEIARLEAEQKELEGRLAAGDASGQVLGRYSEVEQLLGKAMTEWESEQEKAEKLK